MPTLFPEQVEEFICELDAAVEAHLGWTRRILRCAVLRTSPGRDVLAHDAHCRCRFGQWLGAHRSRFSEIDEAATIRLSHQHKRMHGAVRKLCSAILDDGVGQLADLEVFEASQVAFISELAHFKTGFLAQSARLDTLTGLPLRYGLETEFARFRSSANRLGKKVVLMMIDIDHFKLVNDTYGHGIGDQALKHAASIMSAQARKDEPIFRFGGEEFLQIIQVNVAEDAAVAADRLLRAFRNHPMKLPDNQPLYLRVSSGLAEVEPGEEMERAVARGDQALYAAKAAGRDRWCWADASVAQPRKSANAAEMPVGQPSLESVA
ncbi:MAG: diguanylate cyclase [Rhodopseudomonas sp.]|uniref:diguanylate cyclase n=1 Tax=Rhodopseudomonas sp. TaxID=1078 RepID=UPI00182FCBAC|nr:diguanylate cyclase [Rhodopseudomonas sp.]NVN88056.1 diguanylate cyclase [Rhodopseudomonas sp.]